MRKVNRVRRGGVVEGIFRALLRESMGSDLAALTRRRSDTALAVLYDAALLSRALPFLPTAPRTTTDPGRSTSMPPTSRRALPTSWLRWRDATSPRWRRCPPPRTCRPKVIENALMDVAYENFDSSLSID